MVKWCPIIYLGPIGSAVLTFIGYKQTNRQTDRQTDKPNLYIDVLIFKDRTLKKNNIERTRISMWFGLEIDVVGLPPLG